MKSTGAITVLSNDELDAKFNELQANIINELKALASIQQPTELLTIEQAAKFLKVTDTSLRKYANDGTIKGYRIGGRKVFKRHELEQALTPIRTTI